jgi:hypothetical protein
MDEFGEATMAMIKIKLGPDAEAVDIPGMRSMPDSGYANWIDGELFFFDHHENLRAIHGDYPIATTSAQVSLLIAYLQTIEARMKEAEA